MFPDLPLCSLHVPINKYFSEKNKYIKYRGVLNAYQVGADREPACVDKVGLKPTNST